jgi:hypothetical protein
MIMRLIQIAFLVFFLLFIQNAAAGELQVIELRDGSTITGEVLSLANGVYIIKSGSLGTLKVDASKIRTIRTTSSDTKAASPQEMKTLTDKMLSDKEIMDLILSLQSDPDFKKALEDPEILQAISEGDISVLTTNSKFMKLLNNATVQKIDKKVQ